MTPRSVPRQKDHPDLAGNGRHLHDSPRFLVVWTVTILLVSGTVAWGLFLVRRVVLLVYVSGLLAIGFSPFVQMIERQRLLPIGSLRLPRWLAILIVYLTLLAILAGIGVLIVPVITEQAQEFAAQVPQMFYRAQRYLVQRGFAKDRISLQQLMREASANADFAAVLGRCSDLLGGLFGIITILILTFYLLVESESLFSGFLTLMPKSQRAEIRATCAEITTKVRAWLTGQLVLVGVIGASSTIALGLLGMPYFYVLAAIAAVGELVPYLGPLLAAVPGIIIAGNASWQLAIGVAVFYVAQQQIEANLIVPKLMERQVGLSPSGVIIALLFGGALLGIFGAILAIPTAAILQVIVQHAVSNGNRNGKIAAQGSG